MSSSQKSKNYALPIAMMIALFAMISFVTGLQNPMGIIVKNQFGASNFMSQLGNAANFIAYAFMGLPAGMLLQKIGYKKTALFAIAIGFIGVGIQFLSGQAESFAIFLIGAFVSGFSMCMLNTVVNPMLNTLGGGGKKGNQLIQFGGSVNSLAATIIPVLVGYLIGNEMRAQISDANPALFIAMGIFAVVFVVLLLMNIPEPHMSSSDKLQGSMLSNIKGALSYKHFLLGTIAIFVYVGIEVGIPNFVNLYMTSFTTEQFQNYEAEYKKQQDSPTYLAELTKNVEVAEYNYNEAIKKNAPQQEINKLAGSLDAAKDKIYTKEKYEQHQANKFPGLGIDTATAGSVVGTYWFLMLIGRLFIGTFLGAKVSSKTMLTCFSLLGVVLVLLAIFIEPGTTTVKMPVFQKTLSFGMANVPINILLLILCGLCTSVMWGGIFNLAVEGLGKYTAIASGIFMVMVCGGGILPLIQGSIADNYGYLSSYWIVVCGLIYLLFYALVGSKLSNKELSNN